MGRRVLLAPLLPALQCCCCLLLLLLTAASAQTQQGDVLAMQALKNSLALPPSLAWSDPDPCQWDQVVCSDNRVTRIQIGNQGLTGTLPPVFGNLTSLVRFEVMTNNLTGALPSFAGLAQLQVPSFVGIFSFFLFWASRRCLPREFFRRKVSDFQFFCWPFFCNRCCFLTTTISAPFLRISSLVCQLCKRLI